MSKAVAPLMILPRFRVRGEGLPGSGRLLRCLLSREAGDHAGIGADITVVPSGGGGITKDQIDTMIATATEYASEEGSYFTNQFHDTDCLAGYRKVGVELIDQFPKSTGNTVVTVAVDSRSKCLSRDRHP